LTSPLYFIDVIKLKSLYLPGKSSEKITKAFSGLFRTVNTSNDGKITFLQCISATSIALRYFIFNSKTEEELSWRDVNVTLTNYF
jgi:hypothetical protein